MSVNRRLVWMLIVAQLGPGLPVAEVLAQQASPAVASSPFSSASSSFDFAGMLASSNGPFSAQLPTDPPPPPTPRVKVNRTLPKVDPPQEGLHLTEDPTDAEFFRARIFHEPLVPVGPPAQPQEHAAFAAALLRYVDAKRPESVDPLLAFLQAFPRSRWRASLLANVGTVLYSTGYFSKAIQSWDEAWRISKDDSTVYGRGVAAYAVGEWLDAMMSFGRVEELRTRLDELKTRDVGGTAGQKIAIAREALEILENRHHEALSSGALAIDVLRLAVRPKAVGTASARASDASETARGAEPMAKVLADYHPSAAGMSLVELADLAARAGVPGRMVFREVKTEPVVPAIVHLRVGHFTTLVEARDGVYLLRDRIAGDRWVTRQALDDESSGYQFVPNGVAMTGGRKVEDIEARGVVGHCIPGIPRPEDSGDPKCSWDIGCLTGTCIAGMAQYTFHPVTAGLRITDIPVGYAPPRGPAVRFRLAYDHRAAVESQVVPFSNLGPQWEYDWQAYVQEVPMVCSLTTCFVPSVLISLPGAGREQYLGAPDTTTDFGQHWRSRARLVRVSRSPIRYERRLSNGGVEVYSAADSGVEGQRRVFLTDLIDAQGQGLHFTYDANLRLVAVTDALGQVTTLAYDWAADPLKVTSVTDPFGRMATITYTNSGQLETITDVIGITSRFSYSSGDFIAAMTTPYGTTRFRVAGRAIEATDPLGGTEHLEYHQTNSTLPDTLPASEIPTGFAGFNQQMSRYNSFYWDKRAMASYPDLSKAVATHWYLSENNGDFHPGAVSVPHSVKRPLEPRVWYRYRGQPAAGNIVVGESTTPTHEGRVIAPGVTQLRQNTVDAFGNITERLDPLGRRTSFDYATNGVDLLGVRQTTGTMNEPLTAYASYDAQHRPGTFTDGAGQTSTATYNTAGQVLTVTNAKNETTTYAYDTDGYLQSITGPVSGATTSYTYDDYGRARTVTDADGYAVVTDYDLFDRPVKRTYPDGTYEQIVYDKLDPVRRRDRLGRWSYVFYDALRRVVGIRDALGRTVQQRWCTCGSLDAIIDGKGQKTTWERDLQGRVVKETRADGTTETTFTYEPGTGRLATVTDPKLQVTIYTYNLDDTLQQMAFSNASMPTASVSYTYETGYNRLASMVDGTGTTTYAYRAAGTLGAGKPGSLDGPLADDTVTYGYDELGRTTSRTVNGAANALTQTFDALGRVTTEANSLGTFTYGYDGVTSRVASVTYPNGQTSSYVYFGNTGDHRLQTSHHQRPGGATVSKSDYSYDAVGNILTWQQQMDSNPAVEWRYTYDAIDQLLAADVWTTGSTPSKVKRYAYSYDAAGNRTSQQIDDVVTLSAYDALNRLVSRQAGGPLRVAGSVSEPATVMIQGKPVSVSAAGVFSGRVSTTGGTTTFSIEAIDANGNARQQQYEFDTAGPTRTFTFDANGNPTSDGTRTFDWDARNRLSVVHVGTLDVAYEYNGLGALVKKQTFSGGVPGPVLSYVACDNRECEERDAAGARTYLRERQGAKVGTDSWFYVVDHLGSVLAIESATNSAFGRYWYDPFGVQTRGVGSVEPLDAFGGHAIDAESALVRTYYRRYDANEGRWLTQDPIGMKGGLNLYRYVDNNPTGRVDPLGLWGAGGSYGGNASIMTGGLGLSIGGSVTGSFDGTLCSSLTFCVRVGWGFMVNAGTSAAVDVHAGRNESGVSCSIGAGADAGAGPTVGGGFSLYNTGTTHTGGHMGVGYGLSIGFDFCCSKNWCCRLW